MFLCRWGWPYREIAINDMKERRDFLEWCHWLRERRRNPVQEWTGWPWVGVDCPFTATRGQAENVGTDTRVKVNVVTQLLEVLCDCFYFLSERSNDGRRGGGLKRAKWMKCLSKKVREWMEHGDNSRAAPKVCCCLGVIILKSDRSAWLSVYLQPSSTAQVWTGRSVEVDLK